jgi:hypothetical protein
MTDEFKRGFEAAKIAMSCALERQVDHFERLAGAPMLSDGGRQTVTTKLAAYMHAERIVSTIEPKEIDAQFGKVA